MDLFTTQSVAGAVLKLLSFSAGGWSSQESVRHILQSNKCNNGTGICQAMEPLAILRAVSQGFSVGSRGNYISSFWNTITTGFLRRKHLEAFPVCRAIFAALSREGKVGERGERVHTPAMRQEEEVDVEVEEEEMEEEGENSVEVKEEKKEGRGTARGRDVKNQFRNVAWGINKAKARTLEMQLQQTVQNRWRAGQKKYWSGIVFVGTDNVFDDAEINFLMF